VLIVDTTDTRDPAARPVHRVTGTARAAVAGFGRRHPRLRALVLAAALAVPIAVVAIALSLRYTPAQTTQVFGQTFQVKAAPPSLSLSGYGTGELFQEGTFDLPLRFLGPVRPSIALQNFDRNAVVASVVRTKRAGGDGTFTLDSRGAGQAFVHAFADYFRAQTIWACVLVVPLYLIGLGLVTWIRQGRPLANRRHGRRMLAVAAFTLVLNSACIGLAALSASSQLGRVHSLADLVGTTRIAPFPRPAGPVQKDVGIVVIGDSTAAGLGNPLVPDPSQADTACGRSSYAYSTALQQFNPKQRVVNLACSSATIEAGLLGPQDNGVPVPPQVGVVKQMPSVSTVVVSIGANDVHWTDALYACYGLPSCDDQANTRLFQQHLDLFKVQYAQLLEQLATLPQHPNVIVNLYYQPLSDELVCPALTGLLGLGPSAAGSGQAAGATPGSTPSGGSGGSGLPSGGSSPTSAVVQRLIEQKIDPLISQLDQLNFVLAQGAKAFEFAVATPNFTGHELCTSQPWVQGLSDAAPLHPNAAGGLAIAAADQLVMLPAPAAAPGPATPSISGQPTS
jgi:lysophospholipase L1-like esterase